MFVRNIIITFLILAAFTASYCGNGPRNEPDRSAMQSDAGGTAEIVFKEYEHHFGKVAEGEKIACIFTFENKGTADLIVTSATTSCGCTVPKYDTKPVPQGKGGNLEVIFDTSGRNGMQTKTIAVKSNASVPVVLLKITAEVVTSNN